MKHSFLVFRLIVRMPNGEMKAARVRKCGAVVDHDPDNVSILKICAMVYFTAVTGAMSSTAPTLNWKLTLAIWRACLFVV